MSFDEFGWRPPEVTRELDELITQARDAEQVVRAALGSLSAQEQERFVKSMVMGEDGDACVPPLDLSLGIDELCEACLDARGPFNRGDDRRLLRERARIHMRLSREPLDLRSTQDLLAAWDEATRKEPSIRVFVGEPRWRTEADGTPFTGARMAAIFGPLPLGPGRETADPKDIPQLAKVIVNYLQRDDLPPEVVALGLSYLIFRVHPFMDGNGHTIRMLCCDTLHRVGYSEPTLLAYVNGVYFRHDEMCDLSVDIALGRARTEDQVVFLLGLLRNAQEMVIGSLDAPCNNSCVGV